MAVIPQGFEVATPYAGLVRVGVELPADKGARFGPRGFAKLTAAFANLPDKPDDANYEEIWAIVQTNSVQPDGATWNINDAGNNASDNISAAPGIYRVTGLPASPTRFRAAAAVVGEPDVTFIYGTPIVIP